MANRGRGVGVALVRDGDRECLAILRLALSSVAWKLEPSADRDDFANKLQSRHPDIVVIDADRDDGEAFVLMASDAHSVVVAITQDHSDQRSINLLELGADAVFVKPLAPDLLRARLDAMMRRMHRLQPLAPDRYVFENLTVDLRGPSVNVSGHPLHLSATEHRLIHALAENAGRVLSHDQLLREAWGDEYEGNHDLVRTFVSSLRRRLKEAGFDHELIHTERSLGYWVVRPPAEAAEARLRATNSEAQTTRLAVREQRERLRAGMYRLQGSVEKLQQAAYRTTNPQTPPASESPVTK